MRLAGGRIQDVIAPARDQEMSREIRIFEQLLGAAAFGMHEVQRAHGIIQPLLHEDLHARGGPVIFHAPVRCIAFDLDKARELQQRQHSIEDARADFAPMRAELMQRAIAGAKGPALAVRIEVKQIAHHAKARVLRDQFVDQPLALTRLGKTECVLAHGIVETRICPQTRCQQQELVFFFIRAGNMRCAERIQIRCVFWACIIAAPSLTLFVKSGYSFLIRIAFEFDFHA